MASNTDTDNGQKPAVPTLKRQQSIMERPRFAHIDAPSFKFLRSDTNTVEQLSLPDTTEAPPARLRLSIASLSLRDPSKASKSSGPASPALENPGLSPSGLASPSRTPPGKTRRFSILRARPGTESPASPGSNASPLESPTTPTRPRRLSNILGLRRQVSSSSVPHNLPAIAPDSGEDGWERRATILAREHERNHSAQHSSHPSSPIDGSSSEEQLRGAPKNAPVAGAADVDDNIVEAIRLHEAGDLERATAMFGRLADPGGPNNALSQVLYGLALRHGWGCAADPERAVGVLSAAASNAASIETVALQAGSKQGGAAKGELVLAIFELANCFRHGWGVEVDAMAAKQYYETAANLGDSDAMNEVAWCYLHGFGCKKDKMASAKYYRSADLAGNKTLGNTWIWKDKYSPVT